MKKGQVYEGTVEEVLFPNKGVVKVEDCCVQVKHTLPGQRIRFQVNKVRNKKAQGRLQEVLEASSIEDGKAACPLFGRCGGCNYLNVSYENQLELKKNQVKKLLDEVCEDYEFEGILASPAIRGYRNKMEYSFGDEVKDGPLSLGLHKRGSFHDILNADTCELVHPDFNKIVSCTREVFGTLYEQGKVSFYHNLSHEGYLRHLLVRRGTKTGEYLVALVTTSQTKPDFTEWKNQLLALDLEGKIRGILHFTNDSLADVVKSDETKVLYGTDYFMEELMGLEFKVSPFSFFQTNTLGAEVLYQTAREYIGETKDKVVFDLYSGTGTIAQVLSPVAKKVVGVEIVEEAVEAARENAARNGLTNCEFLAGDVLKVLDDIQEKPDLIVLDPPRDGIHPKALRKIIDYGVEHLVYISCKPTSLARDLVVLQEQGYRVERVRCVDMFPMVVHVETVVQLVNIGVKPDYTVRLEVDVDEFYKTVGEDKRDYLDSEEYKKIKAKNKDK